MCVAHRLTFTGLGLAAALVGCARSSERPLLHGPIPPGQENAYVCGSWRYSAVPRGRRLLDIDASREHATAESLTQAIQAAGGEVVHVYGVPRVRARMDVRAATRVSGWVAVVADASRLDVFVIASVRGAMAAEDSARLAARGAVLRGGPGLRGTYWYGVTLPDSVLPELRAVPGVFSVQPGLFCVTSAAGAGQR